jgi:hypothetical protein
MNPWTSAARGLLHGRSARPRIHGVASVWPQFRQIARSEKQAGRQLVIPEMATNTN